MIPTWIIYFSKEGQDSPFFERYWQAQKANDSNLNENDKWFYCYDCSENQVTYEDLRNIAKQLTVTLDEGHQKLIPCVNRESNELRIFCLGDVTDDNTIDRMHFWLAKLRQELLTDNPWTLIPTVRVYAILWRPETIAVGEGLDNYPKTKGFLNELSSLESLNINDRPFHKVFFIQSALIDNKKKLAFFQMELAALNMSLADNRFWDNAYDEIFLNVGEAAVFYESKVQREQEAFTLSNLILYPFCTSTERQFYNEQEAHDYVEKKNADLLNSMSPNDISNNLLFEYPQIPASLYKSEQFSTKRTWTFSYKQIWNDFIKKHLAGFKNRLLNNIRWALDDYEIRYKNKVMANMRDYLNKESIILEDLVFDIYAQHTRLNHIGIPQGREVIKCLRKNIEKIANQSDQVEVNPFALPPIVQEALEQAKDDYPSDADNRTEKILSVMESKLRTLPAFNLAWFVRSLVMGGLLGAIGLTFGSIINVLPTVWGLLLGICPFIYAAISYALHTRRINKLKDQYIACRLDDLRSTLKSFVIEYIKKTYTNLDKFLQWVDKGKLEYLGKALSALKPSDFLFEENEKFQPLLNYMLAIRGQDNIPGEQPLRPVANVDIGEEEVKPSGSFGDHAILGGTPANEVQICRNGESKSLYSLIGPKGLDDCQKMCKELMDESVDITAYQEKFVHFGGATICCTKLLLLLDASGSMCGQPINDLKRVVRELQDRAEVVWIAFNHELVSCSFEGGDLNDLSGDGGTSYLPAIEKAAEYLRGNYADKVILISDGWPGNTLEEILESAKKLNQPLNTITICPYPDHGGGVVEIMKEIAEKTGGKQVTVESAAEISINTTPEIDEMLQAMEGGNFAFHELMRKVHIPACAQALYNYSNDLVHDPYDRIINLLKDYGNSDGIKEWVSASDPTCNLTQVAYAETIHNLSVIGGTNNQEFENSLNNRLRTYVRVYGQDTKSDMIAFMLSFQNVPLNSFAWAGFPNNDMTLNNKAELIQLMNGWPLVNYSNQNIQNN